MKTFGGPVLFLDRNDINTDEIIPAKYLNEITKQDLQPFILEDLKLPGFDPKGAKTKAARVIVSRANFGCGSSREHAPWVFEVNDITAVIAESFARIFRQNMFNCGMAAIELPKATLDLIFSHADDTDASISIDIEAQTLTMSGRGKTKTFNFDISPFDKALVMAGGWVDYADTKYLYSMSANLSGASGAFLRRRRFFSLHLLLCFMKIIKRFQSASSTVLSLIHRKICIYCCKLLLISDNNLKLRLLFIIIFSVFLLAAEESFADSAKQLPEQDSMITIWPLLDYRENSAKKASKLSILGPVFTIEHTAEDKTTAFRPLFHAAEDRNSTRNFSYYLYPLASSETTPDVSRIEFLQILQKNIFRKAEPEEKEQGA